MQIQKSFDCYGNESYASHHEDSWNSRNNHLSHYQSSKNMKSNGAFAHHDSSSRHHHDHGMHGGAGFGGHHHGYVAAGTSMFPSMGSGHGHGHGHGLGLGHFSESSDQYESHKEVYNGGGKMKMDEMRSYERRKYGGGNADASFYAHGRPNMKNSFHKVEWGVKGV